jgi:hypothetical protein
MGLGGFFNVGGTIFILHDGVLPSVARPKVNMNRTLYWLNRLQRTILGHGTYLHWNR